MLRQYEAGLADHGLTRITAVPGTCDVTMSEPSSVWISNRPDLSTVVIIDVRVQQETNQGDVRIGHIARPVETDLAGWLQMSADVWPRPR